MLTAFIKKHQNENNSLSYASQSVYISFQDPALYSQRGAVPYGKTYRINTAVFVAVHEDMYLR
jgi:hypothetical protein